MNVHEYVVCTLGGVTEENWLFLLSRPILWFIRMISAFGIIRFSILDTPRYQNSLKQHLLVSHTMFLS